MLSVSSNAHTAPSAPAESHDNDFHAVLASYAPAAQAARDVPRDTRAVKPVKAIERAHPAANPAKTSRKEEQADDKNASKKAGRDSKLLRDAEQAQTIPSQQTQPLPVRTGMAAQQQGDDHNHQNASDEAVQATPAITDISKAAIAPSSATTPLIKATLPQELIASAAKPSAVPVSTGHQKPVADLVRTDQQKPATTPLPSAVTDEIIAAAKAPQVQQLKVATNNPIAAAKPEQAQPAQRPAPTAAPQRPQSIVANIITMLNAARGTIAVTAQPKQVFAANTDVKPEPAPAKPTRVVDSTAPQPQADTPDRALKAPQFDTRDTSDDNAVAKPLAANSDARVAIAPDRSRDAVLKLVPADGDVRLATASDKNADAAPKPVAASTDARVATAPDRNSDAVLKSVPAGGDVRLATASDKNADAVPKPVAASTDARVATAPDRNSDAVLKSVPAGGDVRFATASDRNADAAPKQVAASTDARVATASDKTARDAQPDSRDAGSQVSEGIAKADAAPASQTAQPAAPQSSPNANVTVSAVVPDAVNVTTPASASVAQRPVSADAHDTDQPNLSALATAIAVKSAAGTKTFDIRMDPPELGRVDVHLSVDRDGKVQAMLSAEHPRTLELLQRDSQHLERALKDAGLDLSNNSLNFSLKGEGRQGDRGGASTARARSMPNAVVARAEAANASVSNFNHASGDGRLDIRV